MGREPLTDREVELAALIAEQNKDEREGHRARQRGVSLDYNFEGGGSFSEVVGYASAAGETSVRRIPRPQKWSRPAIIKHIQAWVKEHGEAPTYHDWNRPNGRGVPSAASLARHFGSFNEAVRAAGFEPRAPGKCRSADPSGKRVRKPKRTARMTPDQVAAAFVLYDHNRMSMPELAALLWRRFDYPSARLCECALNKSFRAEGFKTRSKSQARMALSPEKRTEIARAMAAGRKTRPRGERNPRAILTEADVIEIRASAESTAALARRFGVAAVTVGAARKGRTWRHLAA